jgi:hypothetical protein
VNRQDQSVLDYYVFPAFSQSCLTSRFVLLTFGSWVIDANMQRKLLIALQLKVPLRFIERLASEPVRGVEDPSAFGATPTPKTFMFDPYELT